jgi:signal transduction histidine kinase
LDDLVRVVSELASARDLATITHIVRTAARALTKADGVTFIMREGGECYCADEDAIAPLWKGKRFPMDQCVSGWVMRTKQPVVIRDIYADPRVLQDAYRPTFVRSMAMVPVRRENPVAAIGAYWATEHVAGEKELQRLTILADSAALALANVSLYDELAASVARERAAREAAEASLQAKDQFLAVVSHELRQPLHAALSALQVMSMRRDRERGIHAREVVERQLRQMTRMVDDLLESSRIIRGVVEIQREVVDVRQLAYDAVEVAVPNDADRHRLTIDLGRDPLWASADPTRLRQVFQNVLANAVQIQRARRSDCGQGHDNGRR